MQARTASERPNGQRVQYDHYVVVREASRCDVCTVFLDRVLVYVFCDDHDAALVCPTVTNELIELVTMTRSQSVISRTWIGFM